MKNDSVCYKFNSTSRTKTNSTNEIPEVVRKSSNILPSISLYDNKLKKSFEQTTSSTFQQFNKDNNNIKQLNKNYRKFNSIDFGSTNTNTNNIGNTDNMSRIQANYNKFGTTLKEIPSKYCFNYY